MSPVTPPAGPGQRHVLATHYEEAASDPVAYIDETYHVEADGRSRFYVMSAVVVLQPDRDVIRRELDAQVPEGWWHTTQELRTDEGREHTRDLLGAFQVPDETCVVVHKTAVEADDATGDQARSLVLSRLITDVHHATHASHPPVNLVVLEERRGAVRNNFDRSVAAELVKTGAVRPTFKMAVVSPGSEHLLWLPDLVCSAYRQQMLFNRTDLFDKIRRMTHVVTMP